VNEQRRSPLALRAFLVLLKIVLPLAVLGAAGAGAKHLLDTGPQAERKPRPRHARVVETTIARVSDETTTIVAMGTVRPAREVVLQARVAGEILEVAPAFTPGGRFDTGDPILRIVASDYDLAVLRRAAELAQAKAHLRLEEGNQAVARREAAMLGEDMADADEDLMLRAPQLAVARAAVAFAEAMLREADLAAGRTALKAPFPCVVRDRRVERGAQVTTATSLATLVGTEVYWVEVAVPVAQLRWIDVPDAPGGTGARAMVEDTAAWGHGVAREGRVIRLLPALEAEGRLARLLVAVNDPLAEPELLLDSYVRVAIEGRPLAGVVALDRALLRDGDATWILRDDGTLEIRALAIAFRGAERVLVRDGLRDGERIVTTDLSAPVDGMPLRARTESE
jgi:RND family efflux transporter MFP subunit